MRPKGIMELSAKISRVLQRIEMITGVVCLAVMLVVIVLNIFFRYVLYKPIFWSDELSNYLFIWMSFLASAYVMGNDDHVRVTVIEQRLPEKLRNPVHMIMNLIILAVFLCYIEPSFSILYKLKRSNMMRIPLKFIYVIIPLAFFLMAIHVVNNIIQDLYRIGDSRDGSVKPEQVVTK